MAQTVTITKNQLDNLVARIEKLEKLVRSLLTREETAQPPYGSGEWWAKEIKEAEKEFKEGKGIAFNSAKEAITWLNS